MLPSTVLIRGVIVMHFRNQLSRGGLGYMGAGVQVQEETRHWGGRWEAMPQAQTRRLTASRRLLKMSERLTTQLWLLEKQPSHSKRRG